MPRPTSDQPTEVELQILTVLWDNGPATVREIHNALRDIKETNYSTTVKMLSIMLEKNLVRRNANRRPQVYRAVVSRDKAQQKMLAGLIHKVYEGSAKSLVMQALTTQQASKEDLAEIRRLLDQIEGDKS